MIFFGQILFHTFVFTITFQIKNSIQSHILAERLSRPVGRSHNSYGIFFTFLNHRIHRHHRATLTRIHVRAKLSRNFSRETFHLKHFTGKLHDRPFWSRSGASARQEKAPSTHMRCALTWNWWCSSTWWSSWRNCSQSTVVPFAGTRRTPVSRRKWKPW